jgi:polyhydroxyalkanoate synthesis repressor PhaR
MKRIIKRYGNRKLYDTCESRYITLDEIAGYVRNGEEVTVLENATGADVTAVAFALIILEEERRHGGYVSLPLLRQLVRGGDQVPQGVAERESAELGGLAGFPGGRVDDFIVGGEHLVGNGGHRPID